MENVMQLINKVKEYVGNMRCQFERGRLKILAAVFALSMSGCDSPPSSIWRAETQGSVVGYTFSGSFYSVNESGYRLDGLYGSAKRGRSILWEFGDGSEYRQTEPGEVVEHTYAEPGEYTVVATEKLENGEDAFWIDGNKIADELAITVPSLHENLIHGDN
jgi:hypothetical protein